ncbi:MAG: hypothetical protein A3B37_00090 [Candidatus Sungbacteria bacterium RIFCSPLOWO2_01_FULL_59_16]|uniref:Uncharacterized protein n=1 Tax=Candidatus Sungbacteria bacterium RIFCSPLOWO2_01_FULL_59_16 TaxID=1802280 RepID=A0A1G2LA92_9BACT|nr:MAG: hypothetical protein A3B37_00090 [Candidatus Sungbacteria bacterium RIFCSPLOWO2_01_FULL_59_16]
MTFLIQIPQAVGPACRPASPALPAEGEARHGRQRGEQQNRMLCQELYGVCSKIKTLQDFGVLAGRALSPRQNHCMLAYSTFPGPQGSEYHRVHVLSRLCSEWEKVGHTWIKDQQTAALARGSEAGRNPGASDIITTHA